jgi:hypothetical protein
MTLFTDSRENRRCAAEKSAAHLSFFPVFQIPVNEYVSIDQYGNRYSTEDGSFKPGVRRRTAGKGKKESGSVHKQQQNNSCQGQNTFHEEISFHIIEMSIRETNISVNEKACL